MSVRRFGRAWLPLALTLAFAGALAQPAEASHRPPQLSLEPESDTNVVGQEHCVKAKLKEQGHGSDPIVGASIRFSVSGANTASGVGTTDAKGEATFCYTGTKAGEDMITAFADLNRNGLQDTGEPTAMARKTYTPGPAAAVTVSPATDTNTVGEQHCVTATVTDQFGNPVGSGAQVLFTVAGANTAAGTRSTDTAGKATFCYTGTNAGADTIRAVADVDKDGSADLGEPLGLATKLYTPAGPTALTLSPATATNTVGQEHCLTATATPASAGVSIVFAVTGANTAGGTRTTDSSGKATFCYTGQQAGPDVITAFADTNRNGRLDAGELVATATKTYVPGAPATLVLQPPSAENTVGTQHCVTAKTTDAFGNPVAGATVRFTVSGANAATGTASTDLNGNAVFCYTGTRAGLDTISAFADSNNSGTQDFGEPTGAATKLYHPGAPRSVSVEPKVKTNVVGEEHCVTATVHDEFGNPVGAGVAVFFTVTGANPQATATRTTNADGQATFCYTGTKAGADAITAVADANGNNRSDAGEPTGTATKTYLPGPPAALELAPESAQNRAGEEHCVTATVNDRFGNRVGAGNTIVFSVAGANPSATPVPVLTDANGQARFCYTGTRAGTDTITAFADNNRNAARDEGEPADTATKTYVPGPPARVTVTPATAENTVGEEHCVTAAVEDRFGNPVGAGIAVFFTVTGANSASGSATTDADSRARFCYTGTRAGLDTITALADANGNAQADAGEPAGTATKTYLPGPPATLVLSPKTATNTVGEEHCVTATVSDRFGNRTPNVTVRFTVTGSVTTEGDGVTLGAGGSRTTNGQGEATFCFRSELPGENLITAYADTNGNGVQDAGEPFDTAAKTYVVPASSPLCEVDVHDGGRIVAVNGDRATFGGNAKTDSGAKVVSGSQEYNDHGPSAPLRVKSIEILAVVCEGSRATIYGIAAVDSDVAPYADGTFPFRVRVLDAGEPSNGDTYGILVGNGYYSGDNRRLEGGNVQVRQTAT